MPLTSAFSIPGHFAFSSRKPRGQVIYESLRDGQGDTYDESFDSTQGARLYAQAMCLASADLQNQRAGNNRNPAKATELLPELERDYQVVPPYNATIPERRAVLAGRARAVRGSRLEATEDAMRRLIGDDFVRIEATEIGDLVTWPASPGDVGVFATEGTRKKLFRIDSYVAITGTPLVLPITRLANTEAPLAGERYCFDPDSRGATESVEILAATGSTITAQFTRAHESGTVAVRPHPLWISNQRQLVVVVTVAAATDQETRRKINEQMARMVRGVSQWGITTDAGPLTPDDPTLGDLRVARPT